MQRLKEEPYRFNFYLAVRRLENLHRDRPRVGRANRGREEYVRFAQDPSLAFAPSSIARFEASEQGLPPRMFVTFFGLMGPNGPLPLHLTEYARDRERNYDDATLARFMDMFHHRMTALFYRAWAVNQQAVSFDRDDDRFAAYIGSLFGIGDESLRNRDSVPDLAKLFYSGRLAGQTRNAEGLCSIIAEYFGIPTELVEFTGQWIELPPESRCVLGRTPMTASLGRTAVVGEHVWDCRQKFRLRLGPLNLETFESFLPGGERLNQLIDWVRNYVCEEYAWDVQLILRAQDVPDLQLGQSGRLGWSTWLATGALTRDADDLILDPSLH